MLIISLTLYLYLKIGSAIGSFCCITPNVKPSDFDQKVKPLLEINAARIGGFMEMQALCRKERTLSQQAVTLVSHSSSVHMPINLPAFGGHSKTNIVVDSDDSINFVY